MRQYQLKETKEIQKTIKKIVCNKCGREIPFDKSGPQEDFLSEEKRWGYFSDKDNQVDCFDLCEKCYDEFVSTFVIPIGE